MRHVDEIELLFEKKGKTFLRQGDKFIKVFPKGYSKTAIMTEVHNQMQIYGQGISAPKVYEVTAIDGRLAIVMDYIEGTTNSTMEQFVDLTVKISGGNAEPFKDQMEQVDELVLKSGFSHEIIKNIYGRLSKFASYGKKVCHGDFHQKNVLVREDDTTTVIDFEYTTKGNILLDVARTYILYYICGEKQLAEQYINAFCAKTGYGVKDIRYLIPVAAALHYGRCTNAQKLPLLLPFIDLLSRE